MKQLFSLENFLKIYKYENKKGIYLDRLISRKLDKYSKRILILNTMIEKNQKIKDSTKLQNLYLFKNSLIKFKDNLLKNELTKIINNLKTNKYSIEFKSFYKNGKKIYFFEDNSTLFFLLKKLQFNLKLSYDVKQSNKYELTYQLKNILENNFPKFIIKTDLSSFYENINLKRMKYLISANNTLTNNSKKLIFKILNEYEIYSKKSLGIPRGIGISAYLAEIYLKDFDNDIKSIPEITYYARYVDDIVIVFTPNILSNTYSYLEQVKNIIHKYNLYINEKKTSVFNFTEPTSNSTNIKNECLEFLGYKYHFSNKKDCHKLLIGFTEKKLNKYINKIRLTFDTYYKESKYNEKKARKYLIYRLQYLTGNTKLLNAKKDILIGINFSNTLFNKKDELIYLDAYLEKRISDLNCYFKIKDKFGGHVNIDKIKKRISKYSFVTGWEKKSFTKFTYREIEKITKIWKQYV